MALIVKRSFKLLIALSILLLSFAFTPFVALPDERFDWQKFIGTYDDNPILMIDQNVGGLGSLFLVEGKNYMPGVTVDIEVNGNLIGSGVRLPANTITPDANGEFSFVINTSAEQSLIQQGRYFIRTSGGGVASFTLDPSLSPHTPTETEGLPELALPAGIAYTHFVNLPLVLR